MAVSIFITGSTGVIGREVVKQVVKRGLTVRAGVHTPSKFEYIKFEGDEPAFIDYGDLMSLDRAFSGIHTLFLLTPLVREKAEFTRRIVDKAKEKNIQFIVMLSMINANAQATVFTRWHYLEEKYLENSGIPFAIIRANILMQNFLRYVHPSGGLIYMPLNSALVSYVDARDIAAVAVQILIDHKPHLGKTYDLTGPNSLTMDVVAHTLSGVVGAHLGYVEISSETARHAMEIANTPQWLIDGMLELFAAQRMGHNSRITTTIEAILGRKAISFDQFVFDFRNAFKAIIEQEHNLHLS